MTARYRGRYAPSPTGPLHFGSVVAAVASYAEARSRGGTWVLRIDDLDRPRVVPGAADDILRTLEGLGLEWDGPVVWQSRRGPAYHAALHALRSRGLVYPCRCSRREIADSSVRGIEGYVYPGTCRGGCRGPARAWRMNAGHAAVMFTDALQGEVRQDVGAAIGDYVVYRSDGQYAYHLACALDDAAQGVTHVVRGADLLVSTPRQILIQQALRLPTPQYAHVPVVLNSRGEKLSKQTQAAAIDARHANAALAAALRFLGQDVPEDAERRRCTDLWPLVLPRWTLARVPRVAARAPDGCSLLPAPVKA